MTKDNFSDSASLEDIRKPFFETQLEQIGLTESQIIAQNLSELKESLSRINDAITHPEGFGVLGIKFHAKIGPVVAPPSDCLFKIGIIPLLLERKKIILERINELSAEEKIERLQSLSENIAEEDIRQKLAEGLKALQEEATKYKQEVQDVAARETEEKIKLEREVAQQKVEVFERKSKIWLSFLQRESAASLIGAVVLLLLTLALIFGKESQILSNGFLVILGYFFGQSSSRTRQDNNTPTSPNNSSLTNM